MKIPPFLLLPPNRVWRAYLGGKNLDILEKQDRPRDSNYPEDWIGSTTPANLKGREEYKNEGHSKVIINNTNWFFKDLCQQYPDEMLGPAHFKKFGANMGILVKLLDSSMRLQLQAHPTREFAKNKLNSDFGKTESYFILKIREDVTHPYIYLGFQHPPNAEKFREIIENQNLDELLECFEKIPINQGDVFLVPGGLPHAIGEGILMIELMEPSDLVVRIEFTRDGITLPEGMRFMGMDLDFAISMFTFDQKTIQDIQKNYFLRPRIIYEDENGSYEEIYIDHTITPCFNMNKLNIKNHFQKQKLDSYAILIVVSGTGRIIANEMNEVLEFGTKIFIPFSTKEIIFESKTQLEVLWITPPK